MIQVEVKTAAYMDDTTLVNYNQDNMQELINICNEFYKINNIRLLDTIFIGFYSSVIFLYGNKAYNIYLFAAII